MMVLTIQARCVTAMDNFGVEYSADCIEVERPRHERGERQPFTLPRVCTVWWWVH